MNKFMKIQGMCHSLSLRETARDAQNDHSFYHGCFVAKEIRKEWSLL